MRPSRGERSARRASSVRGEKRQPGVFPVPAGGPAIDHDQVRFPPGTRPKDPLHDRRGEHEGLFHQPETVADPPPASELGEPGQGDVLGPDVPVLESLIPPEGGQDRLPVDAVGAD